MSHRKTLGLLSVVLLLTVCTPPREPEGRGNQVPDPAMLTDAEYEPTDEDRRIQASKEPLPLPEEPPAGDPTGEGGPSLMLSDQEERPKAEAMQSGEPSPIPDEPRRPRR